MDDCDFWDEMFPALPYVFKLSLAVIDGCGYDSYSAEKQCQLYSRTEEILRGIIKDL